MIEKLKTAITMHKQGQVSEAIAVYEELAAVDHDNADVRHLLGIAHHQLGKPSEALLHLEHAVSLAPGNVLFRNDLASAQLVLGMVNEAQSNYRVALEQDGTSISALLGLGTACRHVGEHAAAAKLLTKAACLDPGSYAAAFNAGAALYTCGRFQESAQQLGNACNLQRDPVAYKMLGLALEKTGDYRAALKSFKAAIQLDHGDAEAWYNLGNALTDTANTKEAFVCYRKALEIKPDYLEARTNLAETLQSVGRIDESLFEYEKALETAPRHPLVVSNALMSLNYTDQAGKKEIFEKHRSLALRLVGQADESNAVRVISNPKLLTIGYVSPDFRTHSVARFLKPILEKHNTSSFNVHLYSNVHEPDENTKAFQSLGHSWRDLVGVSDADARSLVANDKVDVLIDLAGHTRGNRLGIFARRAAPVQVTYLGYPNTTGLECMDFRLTDAVADPQGHEEYHTEKLYRLNPCFLCYDRTVSPIVPIAEDAAKPFTFGCFNNVAKMSPSSLAAWAEILSQSNDSRLILKHRFFDDPSVRGDFEERFVKLGIASGRVVFMGFSNSAQEHLGVYNQIDITVDTFPYNGTTTTCEALSMGVPVVTFSGDRHASRVSASILRASGLGEFVVRDTQDYVDTLVKFSRDGRRTTDNRAALSDRFLSSSVCDSETFVRRIEAAFQDMAQMQRGVAA